MTALSGPFIASAITLRSWGNPPQQGLRMQAFFFSVGCHSASEAHQANRLTKDVFSQLQGGSSWRHSRDVWPSTSEATPGQWLPLDSSRVNFFVRLEGVPWRGHRITQRQHSSSSYDADREDHPKRNTGASGTS